MLTIGRKSRGQRPRLQAKVCGRCGVFSAWESRVQVSGFGIQGSGFRFQDDQPSTLHHQRLARGRDRENIEHRTSNIERRTRSFKKTPREAKRFTRLIFWKMDKAKFVAAREIMIEFVFSLCENGFVPGSVTRPTGRIQ